MGNSASSNQNPVDITIDGDDSASGAASSGVTPVHPVDDKSKYRSFPGSAILEKTFCGSIDTTDPSEYENVDVTTRLLHKAEIMCVSSPRRKDPDLSAFDSDEEYDDDGILDLSNAGGSRESAGDDSGSNRKPRQPVNPSSALLARALVSEVTNNPNTMNSVQMADRERKLLKAQMAAAAKRASQPNSANQSNSTAQPIGVPGGVGPPHMFHSLAYAVTGDETAGNLCVHPSHNDGSARTSSMMAPGQLQANRAAQEKGGPTALDGWQHNPDTPLSSHAVTIGLSLSRRYPNVGHPQTVTRQTAFDWNEIQDRAYKYVSSTDEYGWRAGGGEPGGPSQVLSEDDNSQMGNHSKPDATLCEKLPAPDTVHLPIIQINCQSEEEVDQVIHALASGDIFIPHMALLPEALSVNGISPPDLVVRFGCERNDDLPPDEWPNWCLEFMHNQLYEYFYSMGAVWMKRPFSITLARKVKWKTVKHMNRYFAHAERVIDMWREKGPQYLDPQLSYIEGGATPEEVAHPHGLYLHRRDVPGGPTNYFAPNFERPYTTKMTRSLLGNVLGKSWDKKRREWTSEPIPRLITPKMLLAIACGCTDPTEQGFMAKEVTSNTIPTSHQAMAVTSFTSMPLDSDQTDMLQTPAKPASHTIIGTASSATSEAEPGMSSPASTDPSQISSRSGKDGEEKKTDDLEEAPQPRSFGGKTQMKDRSTEAQSVAMSSTTVMHANVSRNPPGTKLGGSPGMQLHNDGNEWGGVPSNSSSAEEPSQALDQERKRQEKLLRKMLIDPKQSNESLPKQGGRKKSGYLMSPTGALSPTKIMGSESGQSMEYSHDGSSAYVLHDAGSASLLGQKFASDGGTPSNASRAASSAGARRGGPEEEDSLSIQESSSSVVSTIPTDEELFSMGWAKALDPNSGNYYYFTLDRSKIVWDNPIYASRSAD